MLAFDCKKVPDELLPYVGLLSSVLGLMDTHKHTYPELTNEININSGGISTDAAIYTDSKDFSKYTVMYEVKGKVLYEKLPFVLEMMHEIIYETKFEDEKRLLDDATRELMQTCSQAAQKAEGVTLPLSVFIRVVDDDEIRAINREQRGKDASTDVLSFPTVNYPKGKTAGACERLLREEFDPDVDACAIGDIVISMDHVRAQAAEYGHSERRECGYLLTHGLFHLMGYDHMTDEDKPVMRAMEEKALASIGLTREE